jgi:acyl dehydratase
MTLYFEDIEPGATYEVGAYTVTDEEIITFAEQFDPQPFHVDSEAASESMFGELVASGLHTLCLSVRLFVTEFVQGGPELANMGGLGMDELRWHEPVRPGDTLTLTVEVVEARPSETVDDEPVLSVTSHNIVERRD